MPDYGVSDTEREILTKLDQILGIVQDLQARQRAMEQRQKVIKEGVEQEQEGSFGRSDLGSKS